MALDRSQDASATARSEQTAFFQNWESKSRSPNQSDSLDDSRFSFESSHPSPMSTAASPRVRKLRRTLADQSRSAPSGTIPEMGVPNIAIEKIQKQSKSSHPSGQGSPSKQCRTSQSMETFPHRRRSTISRLGAESQKSSVSSIGQRFRRHIRLSIPDFRIPECRIANSARELFPPRQERPGYRWTKASSKDDWVERLISTSRIMQRRAKSTDPDTEPSPGPIQPLRPPPSRNITGFGHQHTVKLETAFSQLKPDSPQEEPEPLLNVSRPSIAARTKTIIAKRVQFALNRRSPSKGSVTEKQSPSTPLKTSFLSARSRTADVLQRASSILHLIVNEVPSRATSDLSNPSRKAPCPGPVKPHNWKSTFHLPVVVRNRARKSPNDSYTSSIRKMWRGPTPFNTPDPSETYKIKRSPSAETEEFPKIDISVRGGTSYLPSEARRINTPPLPSDGPGKKKMGFFFDYNAPASLAGTSITTNPLSVEKEQFPRLPNLHLRRGKTLGGTDWFAAKLAEVDAVDNSASESRALLGLTTGKGKGMEKEEALDVNIPEHLPSSPLCPRHWKHKSGGKGVCWMHGQNGNGMMNGVRNGTGRR